MAVSNAERQKRFRDRRRSAENTCGLTTAQLSDRDKVASEQIFPVPHYSLEIPKFLGWSRYDWSVAPEPLALFVGLHEAWLGWRAENAEMKAIMDRQWEQLQQRVRDIVAEHGDRATRLIQQANGGYWSLLEAYEQDPTLGAGSKRKRATKHVG